MQEQNISKKFGHGPGAKGELHAGLSVYIFFLLSKAPNRPSDFEKSSA